VRVGGVTSIDVTKPGIDKAYGMDKLMELLQVGKDDLLFIGDRLQEGGNDYPVKAMGIDSLEVSRWEDTALVIEGILHTI
jgi:phosphomannomutase